MAAILWRPYGKGAQSILNKEADLDTDSLKLTLHTSTYVPNFDTHQYVSDLTNELGTAGGYTVGGLAVTASALATTAANSWGQVWAASTAYTVGQLVRPTAGNGFIYVATTAGTTGASAPTWPTTMYQTVVDGGVTWSCIGRGAVVFNLTADPTWSTFTAGPFRNVVLSDRTPGTAATQPLIMCGAYGADQTGGGGSFVIQRDPSGLLVLPY